MAYYENTFQKLIKLIKNPKKNIKKIIPYIKSVFFPTTRTIFEFFKIDHFSKPFAGHEELMKIFDYRDGFFVEVGGNDGYLCDPTYYLEKMMGWKGIIIEPLKISSLKTNRKKSIIIQKAAVSSESDKIVKIIDCNAMSFIKGKLDGSYEQHWKKKGEICQNIISRELEVPADTLSNILSEHLLKRDIDLLTIDVEGLELEVLRGLDLDKYQPKFILVEAHNRDRFEKIAKFLYKKYEFYKKITDIDFLFIKI